MPYLTNKQAMSMADAIRLIPLPGELEAAEIYKKAENIKRNFDSWSDFDKLKAYEDIMECISLIEDKIPGGPEFDILMRIKLNVEKIFNSEKT